MEQPLNQLDAARVFLSLVMLGYTSWIDIKTREIYDIVWVVFGGIGLLIALYEVSAGNLSLVGFILPVLFTAAMSILLGYFGLFGGADVEAFIALSLLHPFPPRGLRPALGIVSVIYPLTLFSNSALSGASFAVILLARNLAQLLSGRSLFGGLEGEPTWRKIVIMVTGLRTHISTVRGPPFQYPLEVPVDEEGLKRRLVLMPDIHDDEYAEETFRRLRESGAGDIWVSYTLPYLLFIAVGYVISILFGDVALYLLQPLFPGWS